MQFESNGQAIYLQMADYICEKILLKLYKQEDKIPSVRELAGLLLVNVNTVARTYEFLKQLEIIYDKRGVGYFVSQNGYKKARNYRIKVFYEQELRPVFKIMNMLDLKLDDLQENYDDFKKNYETNK